MGKLDELKNIVADAFKDATAPHQIEVQVKLNSKIVEVEKILDDQDQSLIKMRDAYRDALRNQGSEEPPLTGDISEKTFEQMLEDAKKIK